MSLDATIWAWRQAPLRPSFKLLLLALADRASDDDLCWPTIGRIHDDTGLDRKTILNGLEILRQYGLIEKTNEMRGKTKSVPVYRLIGVIHRHDKLSTSSTEKGTPKMGSYPKNGTAKQYRFSHQAVPKTDKKQSQKRDIEPIREPIREPVREKSGEISPENQNQKPKPDHAQMPDEVRAAMMSLVGKMTKAET